MATQLMLKLGRYPLKKIQSSHLKKTIFQDVEAKYSKFVDLNKWEKVIFIFSNIDSYVCEKNVATMSIKHFNLEKLISWNKSMGNRDY